MTWRDWNFFDSRRIDSKQQIVIPHKILNRFTQHGKEAFLAWLGSKVFAKVISTKERVKEN